MFYKNRCYAQVILVDIAGRMGGKDSLNENKLTHSQLLIMKCVWDHGEDISYQELMSVLAKRFGRDYHRSTLVTFLQQMENKGYITTHREGRFAYVHALMTEEEFQKVHAREETDFWFHGKASIFLSALYKAEGIPAEDAEQIRRLLDEWDH